MYQKTRKSVNLLEEGDKEKLQLSSFLHICYSNSYYHINTYYLRKESST